MSPFAKLMLRFGWIRLSSYGLEVTLDGRLVSARLLPEAQLDLDWSNVPSPAVDLASTFDPALAPVPARKPPPLPAARTRTPIVATPQAPAPQSSPWPATQVASLAPTAPADEALSEEEEWAWQAAVARAKAECDNATLTTQQRSETDDEATGLADTAPLPGSGLRQRSQPEPAEPINDTQVAAEQMETDGEDWEVLVAAALSRDLSAGPDTAVQGAYDDTRIDPDPQLPDFAAAQVTRADLPANDDLPAESVTSINAIKLRPLLAKQSSQSASQDDEWTAMRRQIEAKEIEENGRKMRAMREIQRLQGRAPLGDFKPRRVVAQPQRKRMAAGTSPAPTARPAIRASAAGPALRPNHRAAAMTAGNHDTKIDLPRVTERLSR